MYEPFALEAPLFNIKPLAPVIDKTVPKKPKKKRKSKNKNVSDQTGGGKTKRKSTSINTGTKTAKKLNLEQLFALRNSKIK